MTDTERMIIILAKRILDWHERAPAKLQETHRLPPDLYKELYEAFHKYQNQP